MRDVMLSRVADSLYWLGRLAERAEDTARVLDVNLAMHLDLPPGVPPQWRPVLRTFAVDETFAALYGDGAADDAQAVIEFMSFRLENPSSILSALTAARDNARGVRAIVSSEVWEHLNATYLEVRRFADDGAWRDAPHALFSAVKRGGHLFSGACSATMTHNEGWHFLRMGQLLERADMTSRILDVTTQFPMPRPDDAAGWSENLRWMAVLKSVSGHEMYRKRFQDGLTPWRVAEFLLLDGEFPRSVHYAVIRAEAALRGITGTPRDAYSNEAGRLLGRLRAELAYASIREVLTRGLHEYCDDLQLRLLGVGEAIAESYFAIPAPGPAPAPGAAGGQDQ